MSNQNIRPTNNSSHRRLAVSVAIALGLLWVQYSGQLMRMVMPNGIGGLAYSRSLLASSSDVVVMVLLLVVAGVSLRRCAQVVGLGKPPPHAITDSILLFCAVALFLLALVPIVRPSSLIELLWLAFAGPFFEEITYRALAVGALMRFAGWRFVPAVCLPAVMFGIGHIWQGQDLIELVGLMAITTLGGLVFGWIYVRWGFNLWPAILLHVTLNLTWEVFAFGESALGGWSGNIARVSMTAGMLWITWRRAPASARAVPTKA